MLWETDSGSITLMVFAEPLTTPEMVDAARLKIIGKGKFRADQFIGHFDRAVLPPLPYQEAWRRSLGAVVVKMDQASTIRWKIIQAEAQQKLEASNQAVLDNLEAGVTNPVLTAYRNQLRAIIAVKPVELTAAKTTAELDVIRPAVLDQPVPR